jgi:hypothetical protein
MFLFFYLINIHMTTVYTNPTNPNFLHPNKFQLNFGRLPNVQYFVQSVSVPGISLSEIQRSTPFVDLYSPGEKAIYDVFNITFLVDEELKAWLEIHDWIRAMTFPEKFEEYARLGQLNKVANARGNVFPQFSDASLTILSSANNPIYKFKFYDAFPTTLSTFIVSTSDTPESIITADATFRYAYFDVDKLF